MRRGAVKVILPVLISAFAAIGVAGWPARRNVSSLAITPPMGWNSWDAWGATIDEAQFRDTVTWFANNLRRFSWQYVVIDEGWFAQHPENPAGHQDYTLSGEGLYLPAPNRFPSSAGGKGFRPLADWVHAQGLKFGLHIVRGIPREAVARNLRIAGSHFTAAEAADTSDTCSWNADNYGVKDNKAGQAYYDALADLYAKWGIDYLKVDCISSPWKGGEIHMIQRALDDTARSIVLSLSPGPTPLEDANDAAHSAQLWRISDDMWDLWSKPPGAPRFPQDLRDQFELLAKWETFAGPGHWPDADMLPIGDLGPTPGLGQPRRTRLTRDEVRTMVTLWSIARSPLFIGTNLLRMDAFTESVLTNPELIAVDQYSENNRPVIQKPDTAVWMASAPEHAGDYVAIFNLSDQPLAVNDSLEDLGFPFGRHSIRDLWKRDEIGRLDHIETTLAPHASALYKVESP
jgi:alpha-galactosidase